MSKINLLIIAVVSLVVINICLLGYLFFYQPKIENRPQQLNEQPKNIIIQKLKFDDTQIKAYQDLIDEHRQNVREYNDEIREVKNELYLTLSDNNPTKVSDLQNRLAQLQKEIELVHYNHFAAIKKLCKPDQIAAFNELTAELAAIFGNDKGKPQQSPPPPPPQF